MRPDRDLEERWLPALIERWRATRGREGPPGRLLPGEVKEVAQAVRELSRGLTRDRALVGARYMDDPKLLGAYLLFYWPISYAQGRKLLGELPEVPERALDLGAGPGPLALAALDHGARTVTAADRSAPALEIAGELARAAGRALEVQRWDGLQGSKAAGSWDLISLGHVLNELWSGEARAVEKRLDLLEDLLSTLRPDGSLLIIEPALRETSRALLELRDLLVERGYAIRAPCLYRQGCPALERPGDWCHAERQWRPPEVVEAIAREAAIHKEELKMSYLVVAPRGEGWPAPPPGRLFRIVSEPLFSKGRLRYMGCGPEGRTGLALQRRHLGERNRVFESLQRGDVIAIEGVEAKGDGLAIQGEGAVVRVAAAGEAL